ncbi:MAG: PBP1A family penicillin-binding protein, partial [Alphaproteobacteria bacterium]|nr:PBP1A family penicillin-binding protein [Alphaproteobacteria bacterium]
MITRLVYWGFVLAIWAGIGVAGIVAYYGMQLPAAGTWAVPQRPANIRIEAADGRLVSNRGQMGGEAVALHELPYFVPSAVIAIEDRRFFTHVGIDPVGVLRAFINNTVAGRITAGGSTITQQVAKNLFLSPDQTYGRKIQEALLSMWLERTYSKNEILELYLNRVYFGAGAYGIEAAAQRYFGKSARNLSLGEAAMMAGLLKAPSRLSPDRHPERAATRARVVLNAMAEEGFISTEEAAAAAIDPNKRIRTRIAGAEYYVADWVETLMQSYIGPVEQDVIVSTTIDWELQKQAEFVIRETVNANGEERGFSQGALVAMSTDGAVKAIVGGTDYTESSYNRAVTARRQSGSAFKPIVYLAALEAGLTPDTEIVDEPFEYEGWAPLNFSEKFYGRVTLREALGQSLNTIAARLAIDVGPQQVVNTAYKLGISSRIDPVPSIALGTAEISLLELTSAYAPFANGGMGVIAYVINSIRTVEGEVLYERIPAGPGRVASEANVAAMNDMLSYATTSGSGRNAKLEGWPIAGKTGTSQRFRDALFVGYSGRMITGVWLGNDDNSPMNSVGGSSFPSQIWSEFMQKAHEGVPVVDLPGRYAGTA